MVAIHPALGWGGTGGGARPLHRKCWPSFNPPPTKHNLLFPREQWEKEKEQDKGWIHLRISLKRSIWGTFVKWKYSEILIASMDNGLPSLRMLLLSTLRGGDMYPKAVVLLVKNNSIFRWPRLLCQYYPSSSQCFLLFVLYLYFSNGSEWERVKDHFAGSSLWSGWTGWILRFISPFPPFSMVGAHLPHFPGTQIYIWTKHW